ncbi:hypothetical protein [Mycolicibacterium komossense]|uniref:Uncharacterized protein n=1 Tax=Mycolicibacterium komossense TaxID=1779 RepID=A0ABT3CLX6_9MYCO|nr:hypothetical protein [Mycolicibacterium komossense]MCV7230422.1 hypothetical protein [Mycolicibacterium komossense]
MPDTDPVLRNIIRQWITELPAAERDSLISEVGATATPGSGDPPGEPDSLAAGAALYNKQHGKSITVEGAEQMTQGRWS